MCCDSIFTRQPHCPACRNRLREFSTPQGIKHHRQKVRVNNFREDELLRGKIASDVRDDEEQCVDDAEGCGVGGTHAGEQPCQHNDKYSRVIVATN